MLYIIISFTFEDLSNGVGELLELHLVLLEEICDKGGDMGDHVDGTVK